MGKTALVLGATGLTGSLLVQKLLNDDRFSVVKTFVRRSAGLQHPKLQEHMVAFDRPEEWAGALRGDVAFSALGTTLKQAGSKEAQYRVDYTYQYEFARHAAANGVPMYVLVSSAGADAKSSFFYMRIKDELDEAVAKLPFSSIHILRPGSLTGDRKGKRDGETLSIAVLRVLNRLGIARRYTPIPAAVVAEAMLRLSFVPAGHPSIHTLEQVWEQGGEARP